MLLSKRKGPNLSTHRLTLFGALVFVQPDAADGQICEHSTKATKTDVRVGFSSQM